MVFTQKFPNNDLFGAHHAERFTEIKANIVKECNQNRTEDADIDEERKSKSLYLDLSTELTAIHANYGTWG